MKNKDYIIIHGNKVIEKLKSLTPLKKPWKVHIYKNGQLILLGNYKTIEEAITIYNENAESFNQKTIDYESEHFE